MTAIIGLDVDVPGVRRHLERTLGGGWRQPLPFGPAGFTLYYRRMRLGVIVTQAAYDDVEWIHASIAHDDRDPSYAELVALHQAVFGPDRFAFQVFAPRSVHVNIHAHALHLWGRADGQTVLPPFGAEGTI